MMKLRPRKSVEGMNVKAAEATKVVQEKKGKRLVLGDISNNESSTKRRQSVRSNATPNEKAKVNESSTKRRQPARSKATPNDNAKVNECSANPPQLARREAIRLLSKDAFLPVSELTLGRIDEESPLQNRAAGVNEYSTNPRQLARRKATPNENAEANKSSINRRQSARLKAMLRESETSSIDSQFRLRRIDYDPNVHTEGLAPFDVKDKDDELNVAHYITDMCQHLFHKEPELHPVLYLDSQTDNSKVRAILIDLYCAMKPVNRDYLQLVGVTALFIACKYEEIDPLKVSECVTITGKTYEKKAFLDMEQDILKTLKWRISVPTAFPFLLRFIRIVNATKLQAHAANYYMERTLQEHDFLTYTPSLVCAAAVLLLLNNSDIYRAEKVKNTVLPGIPSILIEYTDFDLADLLKCASKIAKHMAEEPTTVSYRHELIAVKKKFSDKKFGQISESVKWN